MQDLNAKHVAYGNLICIEVITHLKSKYYKIKPAALKENASCMNSMYDVNEQF